MLSNAILCSQTAKCHFSPCTQHPFHFDSLSFCSVFLHMWWTFVRLQTRCFTYVCLNYSFLPIHVMSSLSTHFSLFLLFHAIPNLGCWCCFFPSCCFFFFFFIAWWLFIVMRTRQFLFIRVVFADANAAVFTCSQRNLHFIFNISQQSTNGYTCTVLPFFSLASFPRLWSHRILFAFACVWLVPVYIFTLQILVLLQTFFYPPLAASRLCFCSVFLFIIFISLSIATHLIHLNCVSIVFMIARFAFSPFVQFDSSAFRLRFFLSLADGSQFNLMPHTICKVYESTTNRNATKANCNRFTKQPWTHCEVGIAAEKPSGSTHHTKRCTSSE